MKFKILFIILLINVINYTQPLIPKQELRGVWIATVTNLDWPSSRNLTVAQQKAELINMLETLKLAGVNAIFFQIRTECDALYNSPYEPWSYWLTGQQGTAPSPLYDPLQFAIDETHKRGMELHAWFNPYRAEFHTGEYPLSNQHISVTHPEYTLQVANYKFLNPGLPEVEKYIIKIVKDVATRYNVDGIHMDDYFYPYDPITTQDTATFRIYNRGIADIKDWRRDNINMMIRHLNDTLRVLKPGIKYGVSPFGIWRPGFPPGISGMDAYNTIYCDPMAWLHDRSVDYITPQLYWPFGGGQDYAALGNWWGDSVFANKRHLYIGTGAHKLNSYSASELPNQLRFNRNNPKIQGEVYFEAINFMQNLRGFTDSLKLFLYKAPSITPRMNWKDSLKPNSPTNLAIYLDQTTKKYALKWNAPTIASDGDSASRYAIYRFDHIPTSGDLNSGNNLVGIAGINSLLTKYTSFSTTQGNYFVVTALDENSNESNMSNVFQVTIPVSSVSLLSPVNNFGNIGDTVRITWNSSLEGGSYGIQVAKDSLFANKILDITEFRDTSLVIRNLESQTRYFWRVRAYGHSGVSQYSVVWSFKTAYPNAPVLVYPAHQSTITTITPAFKWNKSVNAATYRFQISTSSTMSTILKDTVLSDTTITLTLLLNKYYFWRVLAKNEYGQSTWTSIWGFKTPLTSDIKDNENIPEDYKLFQNYPNPFNPSTTISFQIPETGRVQLIIYDVLGNEIKTLIDEEKPAGKYEEKFTAEGMASGIYIYKLKVNNFSSARKLILMQ